MYFTGVASTEFKPCRMSDVKIQVQSVVGLIRKSLIKVPNFTFGPWTSSISDLLVSFLVGATFVGLLRISFCYACLSSIVV